MAKQKKWPTAKLPPSPVSAKTHGDPLGWTELFEWRVFREWALSLKDYEGANEETRTTKDTELLQRHDPRLHREERQV